MIRLLVSLVPRRAKLGPQCWFRVATAGPSADEDAALYLVVVKGEQNILSP